MVPSPLIDLRSDTVTRPTPAMREAMARAEVGDDVYGEDPTVNLLQEKAAALLGKEAALFVPSGVMANQIALALHTRPGDAVLVSVGAHVLFYENGAASALSGVQLEPLGSDDGRFTAEDVARHLVPENPVSPPTGLVAIENTHNRGGGRIFPQREAAAIAELVHARGLPLHVDGARLMNAAVASGQSPRELAAPFDTVSLCLSKGLGAPVGSLLAGSKALIARAVRRRKMLGGGMRQAGILAAAGLYALDHHVERLREDHANARRIAEQLAGAPGIRLDPTTVETNLVIFELAPEVPLDAAQLVERARREGVLLSVFGPRRVRAVAHLDVRADDCRRAAQVVLEVLKAA